MKKFQVLSALFAVLAVLLSDVMCAVVAYSYCDLKWCGQYWGCSAPASTAFVYCIPYGAGIVICAVLAWFYYRKGQSCP